MRSRASGRFLLARRVSWTTSPPASSRSRASRPSLASLPSVGRGVRTSNPAPRSGRGSPVRPARRGRRRPPAPGASAATGPGPLEQQAAGALDLEREQRGEPGREPQGPEVGVRVAEPLAVLAGQVDPADVEVAGHVLPEVGQLQARCRSRRKAGRSRRRRRGRGRGPGGRPGWPTACSSRATAS